MQKRLLVPSRVRQVPRQFSWIDQRLVRDHHIERCDPQALALYLFLLTVADAQGLSYYADASIGRVLSLSAPALAAARERLRPLDGSELVRTRLQLRNSTRSLQLAVKVQELRRQQQRQQGGVAHHYAASEPAPTLSRAA